MHTDKTSKHTDIYTRHTNMQTNIHAGRQIDKTYKTGNTDMPDKTDKQPARQKDTLTDIQTIHTYIQSDRQTHGQTHRVTIHIIHTYIQRERRTDRQTDKLEDNTYRQIDRQTDRQSDI